MAIDPTIQKKANDIRTKVYGIEVREDLASGLETMSSQVVDNSEKQRVLEGKQNTVETQFKQVIDETTGKDIVSAPEIIAARNGEANLKARIDKDHQEVTAQLAETARVVGSIENFGGIVDGMTDNQTAFSNAFSSGDAVYIYLPSGKINTSSLTIPSDKDIVISGSGESVTELYCLDRFFTTSNTAKFTTTVSSAIAEGSREVVLASTLEVDIGQLITFTSTERMEETSRVVVKTHSAIVTKKTGNTVTIDRNFPTYFSITGFTITVKGYKVGKIKFSNMTISGEYNGYFGDVWYAKGFEMENVKIVNRHKGYQGETSTGGFDGNQTGGTMHGLRISYSVDTLITNPTFEYLSYGVMPTSGSVGTTIKNSKATRCRHTCAPTGGSQNVAHDGCNAYECYAGYDSHQTAYDSKFINCNSYGDEISVKLRGRYDNVMGCSFDGGLDMIHDVGLRVLDNRSKFIKTISGGCVFNNFLGVGNTINISVNDCYAKGGIRTSAILDSLIINNVKIEISDFIPPKDSNGNDINYLIWLGYAKTTSISNIKLLGAYKGQDQTGGTLSPYTFKAFRIDRNDNGGVVKLSNIEIDGFDYGMDFPSAMNLERFVFEDIQFKNCVRGINNATNYKENPNFNRLSFTGCGTDIYEPNRFRYTTRPIKPIKGQRYWDQTLKKDITFDGASWADAMGTVV